ncbi:BamA/TamA family outer membrane protein [Simiduia curdlanivorans]|uniref:BamA/TamA family outer membrane protein n=1 Tax=Simiduia curdlanivorans TaxID=1492769 RepID=A0ABV8VAZ7_9GAMM|nr:BamA/TamA family outer membrane protein [Simiduia curdlanivorans]MDN3639425.1 BamA/TamA family outer membrane protein [Simiduia curdlanivorans]
MNHMLSGLRFQCGIVFLLLSALVPVAQADMRELLVDPDDGMLDASAMLNTAWGFMPVVMPITEPAVGLGLAGAGVWFHEKLTTTASGKVYLPSVSGLMAMATENGSRGLGGFHQQSWDDDNWSYTGMLFDGKVYLGAYNERLDKQLDYDLDGSFTLHRLARRLSSGLKASLAYQWARSEVGFDDIPDAFNDTNAALEFGLEYDRLDNPLSPMKGLKANLTLKDFNENWGGDSDFRMVKFDGRWHQPMGEWRLATRLLLEQATQQTPFYSLPFVSLRGVPAMAYFGNQVTSLEAEVGYQFSRRWSGIVFAGYGESNSSLRSIPFQFDANISAGGFGFRYLIAKTYGLHAGVDVAHNSDSGSALYIQMGSAWH